MTERFEGKRILITGGTDGIGLAAARRIAREGGTVAVTGLGGDSVGEARDALPEGVLVLDNDASDPAAVASLVEALSDMLPLDGIWFNAGYGGHKAIGDNTADYFDRMMNTNTRGPILQMAALEPHLNDGASVVLTSSNSPLMGLSEESVYAATKAANAAIARVWSGDLVKRRIRVNSVAPGPIKTGFLDRAEGMSDEDREQFLKGVEDIAPLGRWGTPDEAAAVACFLLSDEASYVTGSEYVVDGGLAKR